MKHTIILSENCFGTSIKIDGISLLTEVDNNLHLKLNEDLYNLIFSWLKKSISKFQKDELEHIVNILHYSGNRLYYNCNFTEEELKKLDDLSYGEFICHKINYDTNIILEELNNSKNLMLDVFDWKFIIEYIMLSSESLLVESEFESCDQCANPNYSETYILETND